METDEQRAARLAAAEARRAQKSAAWRRQQEGRHAGHREAKAEERRLWAAGAHRITTSVRIGKLLLVAFPVAACGRCGKPAHLAAMPAGLAARARQGGVCSSCYAWDFLHQAVAPNAETPPWQTVGGVAFLDDLELGVLPAPPEEGDQDRADLQVGQVVE